MRDGSLDPQKTNFNGTIHRKLKMRDTFCKIFPSYNHGKPTVYQNPNSSYTQFVHVYPKRNDDGRYTHKINRENTHKKDEWKIYSESMYKISDMYDMKRKKA